jgi:adenylylsulfate kinase-like enzyme
MQNPPISVLLLTGPTGVGKSVVADAVYELCAAQSQPIALINLDELGYVSPQSPDDPFNARLRLKNLAAIWPNYAATGIRRVIIPYVIVNNAAIEQFQAALPNSNLTTIQLSAPLITITQRIQRRDLGGSTEWHIKRAAELIEIFEGCNFTEAVIDTADKTIAEVAQAVLKQWDHLANTL